MKASEAISTAGIIAIFLGALGLAISKLLVDYPGIIGLIPAFLVSAKWNYAPALLLLSGGAAYIIGKYLFNSTATGPVRDANTPGRTDFAQAQSRPIGPIPTSLQLQFLSNDVQPKIVGLTNVWRWYTLSGVDPISKKRVQIILFIIFNESIHLKQVKIDGGGMNLPIYEVKDSGPRHAIIVFNGDLSGIIKIDAEN